MIFTKNEEQILALERTTGSPRRTVQRSTRFSRSFLPPTPVSCFFLQLATWNFQLMLFLANGEPFNGQPVSLCSFLPLQPPTAVSQESLKGLTASVHRTAQTLYPKPAIAACEIVSASLSCFQISSLKREPMISIMDFQMPDSCQGVPRHHRQSPLRLIA